MTSAHFIWLLVGILTIVAFLASAVWFLIRISMQLGVHLEKFNAHIENKSIHTGREVK